MVNMHLYEGLIVVLSRSLLKTRPRNEASPSSRSSKTFWPSTCPSPVADGAIVISRDREATSPDLLVRSFHFGDLGSDFE